MSASPVLLFLHGVGAGDPDHLWETTLDASLRGLDYPGLASVEVVAPQYAHALRGFDVAQPLPDVTLKKQGRDEARKNRRDFERRIGAVEYRLGRHDEGKAWLGADPLMNFAVGLLPFEQAHNYLTDVQIRAQVLHRILEALPVMGDVVIVGHSLGSVIAVDLLRHLPVGLRVAGLVTIGSPLANSSFDVGKLRDSLEEPPPNLGWWVNLWNALDPVAAHRGVASVFPWMLDFKISTGALLFHAHDARDYLADRHVAAAVGFGIFGSISREVVRPEKGVDIPLDEAERTAVTALRYAHLAGARLKGEQRERFLGALRHVQAAALDEVQSRNGAMNRPLPSAVAHLAFDLSEADAPLPVPCPSRHLDKETAVGLFTALASENVLAPFELSLPKDAWLGALKELSAEFSLGSEFGADVFRAAKEAQGIVSGSSMNWKRWGALGAGAAAVIVATGGLALMAGAGLAGAAAITTALAGFGPGGMVGGLITAGTLVGAGGGGIAFGLASAGTSAETFEAVAARRLAAAIVRREQHLEPDSSAWTFFTQIEREIRRQYEKLDEFSDPSAPSLKELARKIDIVEKVLKYMLETKLGPATVIVR